MGNPDPTKSQSVDKRDAKTSPDPSSEATSDKTVSDLEESEATADSKPPEPSDVPSPDGSPTPEPSGDSADSSENGGPM